MTEVGIDCDDRRLFFPATQRNRQPLVEVLRRWLPGRGQVLELASGSGEHAVTFQHQFPGIVWYSSDPDPDHCASVRAWIVHQGLADSMPAPLRLDVRHRPWPLPHELSKGLDAVVAINLIHIAPWKCSQALFAEAANWLRPSAPLVLYGPFRQGGAHTSESNAAFDRSLRSRCAEWGVRDLEAVQRLASDCGFADALIQAMPANNLAVAFRR